MKELKLTEHKLENHLSSTINARELHFELESKKDFSNWIKARIAKFGFIEGEDYLIILTQTGEQKGSGGSNKIEYFISLDMAKELAMVEATKKGREARQYFIKCEKQLRKLEKQRLTVDWQEARSKGKGVRGNLGKAIQEYERYCDSTGHVRKDKEGNPKPESRNYYSLITSEIYAQLFLDRKLKGVRDNLDALQLQFLTICEGALSEEIRRHIDAGMEYHEIYYACKQRLTETVLALSATRVSSFGTNAIRLAWEVRETPASYTLN
jgi:phage anti-repressor protein